MNKTLKLSILIILPLAVGAMVYTTARKLRQKKQTAEQIRQLPRFEFTSLNGEKITNEDLKPNTPLAFIFFSTDCDYCHYEVRELKKNIDRFNEYQIYMVCAEKRENISGFVKVYELDKYPQIKVLQDSARKFYDYFGATVVPSVYIYDRNSRLVKNYKGEVKMEAILNAIEGKNETI
jgi:peroxiredoxin